MGDLSLLCCQNPDCPDFGRRRRDNPRAASRYGPARQRRMLACRTCQACPPERKGAALFASRLPGDQALAAFQHPRDGCGARQADRLTGLDKGTAVRYAPRAGTHARQAHDELVAFSPDDPGGPNHDPVGSAPAVPHRARPGAPLPAPRPRRR